MNFLERQLESPVRVVRIKRLFYVGLALVVLAELALPYLLQDEHHDFSFEGWPTFGSLYGLVSCVAIIVLSKLIGKAWLMRREDYYDS